MQRSEEDMRWASQSLSPAYIASVKWNSAQPATRVIQCSAAVAATVQATKPNAGIQFSQAQQQIMTSEN